MRLSPIKFLDVEPRYRVRIRISVLYEGASAMHSVVNVVIPRKLLERVRREGVDIESLIIDLLMSRLNLDPMEEVEAHLELAEAFLEEGLRLVERDPVQASEKLYKAAEECIKALAKHLKLDEIISRVRSRGRWTVSDLEKVARIAARKISEEIYIAWDRANYLHVWGFHEARLDSEAVKARAPYIKKMLELVKEHVARR